MKNGLTMLEMAEEFDKWLKYVGNDVYIWELAYVFEKRPKYFSKWRRSVGNGSNMWGNDLIIWQTD